MEFVRKMWEEEQGQDLVEYTLLLAFLSLASASLFLSSGAGIKGLWTKANTVIENANAAASPAI